MPNNSPADFYGITSYTTSNSTASLGTPQLEVECLAVIKEQWLSDIQTVSFSTEPFMVFTNFTQLCYGRRTIDDL